MKTFKSLLLELDACQSGREWVGDKTVQEFVATAERGDWMLWLAKKANIPLKELTLAKGHCAATVLHLMKDERSKKAVEAAILFGEGKITRDELNAAYADAAAAYDVADAADYTAYAAATAADYTATAVATAYAAALSARTKNRNATADICRKYIGQLIIDHVNELLK